jgi:hypothetical protein
VDLGPGSGSVGHWGLLDTRAPSTLGAGANRGATKRERRARGLHFVVHQTAGGSRTVQCQHQWVAADAPSVPVLWGMAYHYGCTGRKRRPRASSPMVTRGGGAADFGWQ